MKNLIFGLITFFFLGTVMYGQSNPLNPQDKAGYYHNLFLDDFVKTYDEEKKYSEEVVINDINRIFDERGFEFNIDMILNEKTYDFIDQINHSQNEIEFLVRHEYISKLAGEYLSSIELELKKNNTTTEFLDRIMEIESQILNDKNLDKKDSELLLCFASITRYSGYYWSQDENLKKYSQMTTKGGSRRIGEADLRGGIEGGVLGLIVGGTVATPLGAAPGWFVGAVGGAAVSSIGEAIGVSTGWF